MQEYRDFFLCDNFTLPLFHPQLVNLPSQFSPLYLLRSFLNVLIRRNGWQWIVLAPFSQLDAGLVIPSSDLPFTRVNEREEGRISHERDCAKGEREVERPRSSLNVVC